MFLGAYVKQVSSSLGLSISPSSVSVTLVEDPLTNTLFTYPDVGGYYTLNVGPNWSFAGILTRYEIDVRNIGGRSIRLTINDPREIMQNAPVVLSPGSQTIVDRISGTQCSVLDIFGSYNYGAFNLSTWNEAGMPARNILLALTGGSVGIGDGVITIPQQTLNAFGETYRFELSALEDVIDLDYRVNTNLVPLSNLIEEMSARNAFDWYVTSERASDNIIDVTVHIIDRSEDNQDIGLVDFLADHPNRIVSATSGIELRNELSCMVLQGAPVETMQKVDIVGLANEPIDLVPESGIARYVMTEDEMRIVLGGRQAWEVWLSIPGDDGGGGGLSRYGSLIPNSYLRGITGEDATELLEKVKNKNLVKHPERVVDAYINDLNAGHVLAGRIYEKLKSHAETSYGKRWVHNDISAEIIESCWTRDVVDGDNDPFEHFRQQDGRTRGFVEFLITQSGSPINLGITSSPNLTNMVSTFGDIPAFRNVTQFGKTFARAVGGNLLASGIVLSLDNQTLDLANSVISMDKSAYTFNKSSSSAISDKTSLFCACTIDKDGVVRIESPILEAKPTSEDLLARLILAAGGSPAAETLGAIEGNLLNELTSLNSQLAAATDEDEIEQIQDRIDSVNERLTEVRRRISQGINKVGGATDADGNEQDSVVKIIENLKRIYGPGSFEMHSSAYQPNSVYIPTRSRFLRYGPVFPSTLDINTQGRLEIVQDDGYAPWEFGGFALMAEAMQLKVDSAISTVREVFSGTVVVAGFPEYNIGDAIERNANINNISISFGDGGVTTTYSLQTFTRKFGQFTKEDWTRLAIFANNGGARLLPRRLVNFIENHRVGVNRQFTGRGSSGASPTTGGAGNLG